MVGGCNNTLDKLKRICGGVVRSGMIFVFYVHEESKRGELLFAHYEDLWKMNSFVCVVLIFELKFV
jgi:hypothetical protein